MKQSDSTTILFAIIFKYMYVYNNNIHTYKHTYIYYISAVKTFLIRGKIIAVYHN